MFAEHGTECSFEDIAREAGVGVGTVYRRFPDRRTLIEALLEERRVDVDRAATEALALEDPRAAVSAFVGSVARMQVEDRGLRDLLDDHGFVSAGVALLRERLSPTAEELACRLRDDGAARPDLTGADLLVLIRMLGSLTREQADAPTRDGAPEPMDAPEERDAPDSGSNGSMSTGFDRYLGILLDGLRCAPINR
jgi:AcrR family transcriptional regulator